MMYKIEVTRPNGEKQVIETDNAVIVFGNVGQKDICLLSRDGNENNPEIADLITDALNVYVEKATGDDRNERIVGIGLMQMMNGMKFKETLRKETEKIIAEKTLGQPFSGLGGRLTNFGL
jgi:hypothetical protein